MPVAYYASHMYKQLSNGSLPITLILKQIAKISIHKQPQKYGTPYTLLEAGELGVRRIGFRIAGLDASPPGIECVHQ